MDLIFKSNENPINTFKQASHSCDRSLCVMININVQRIKLVVVGFMWRTYWDLSSHKSGHSKL